MNDLRRNWSRFQTGLIAVTLFPSASCAMTGVQIGSVGPKTRINSDREKSAQVQSRPYPLPLEVSGLNMNACTVKYAGIPLYWSGNYQILQLQADVESLFDVSVKTYNEEVKMAYPKIKDSADCLSEPTPHGSSTSYHAILTVRKRCQDVEWSITEDAPTCNIKIVVKPL